MTTYYSLTFATLLAAMAVPLSAQPLAGDAPAGDTKAASAQKLQLHRASRIVHAGVHAPDNRKIGNITDLVLDRRRGAVAYAIVSFGGVLGVGKKLHAIPWQALQPSDDGKYYILHADKETLNKAPAFDKARWPDMTDQRWSAEIERYWSSRVGQGMNDNTVSSGPTGAVDPEELKRSGGQ